MKFVYLYGALRFLQFYSFTVFDEQKRWIYSVFTSKEHENPFVEHENNVLENCKTVKL